MRCLIALLILFMMYAGSAQENLAFGKTVKSNWPPLYGKSLSSLTDGKKAEAGKGKDYFNSPETLMFMTGYKATGLEIDIDLEAVRGIDYIVYSTMGQYGRGNIVMPFAVRMYLSDDGANYRYYGNLAEDCALDTPDIGDEIQPYRFEMRSRRLNGHGRYVKLLIRGTNYFYCDEIEVFGNASPGSNDGTAVTEFKVDDKDVTISGIKRRYGVDLKHTVRAINALPENMRRPLLAEAETLKEKIVKYEFAGDPRSARLVMPYDRLHREIYALFGKTASAAKLSPIHLSCPDEYRFIRQFTFPAGKAVPISRKMMRNEQRGAAFNLFNATAVEQTISFRITGSAEHNIRPKLVEFTDTIGNIPVGAALKDLKVKDGVYTVNLPVGMTTQVWLGIDTAGVAPGKYSAEIRFQQQGLANLPVHLEVSKFSLPAKFSLDAGLWDYTYSYVYGITPENIDAVTGLLNREGISPWGHAGMPKDRANAQPDFTGLDKMREKFPDARRYYLFFGLNADSGFCGLKRGTPEFKEAVGAWAQQWQTGLTERGLDKGKAVFHLLDEPNSEATFLALAEWAEAVKSGAPDIPIIWNPNAFPDGNLKAAERALQYCDMIMPRISKSLYSGAAWQQLFKKYRDKGGQMQYYDCCGPTRMLDPDYYRLMAWYAFRDHAVGVGFWQLSSICPWNDYLILNNTWPVIFLNADGVQVSKSFEALREGRIDFEYMSMLREQIGQLRRARQNHRAEQTQKALDQLLAEIFAAQDRRPVGGKYYAEFWHTDMSLSPSMNTVREKILDILEQNAALLKQQ